MVKRLLSMGIGIIILFLVMLSNNLYVFNFALTVICLIGLYEFYQAFRKKDFRPFCTIAYAVGLGVFFVNFQFPFINTDSLKMILIEIVPILLLLFFSLLLLSKGKNNVLDVCITLFGIVYIPFFLLFLTLTRQLDFGEYYVWYILGGAWVTDSFAFLIGRKFGKHKFSKISPNKTVEGVIAGIVFCSTFYGLYTAYLVNIDVSSLSIITMSIIGALISIISQIGDLAASSIKRFCEVKDFGRIMPGHGGILDRFDSVIMISPFVYMFLQILVR